MLTLPAALSPLSEAHAHAFALAARRSRSLHQGWVRPPTQADQVAALASRRQGPTDFGFVIQAPETAAVAGYVEITNIVRGPFQSACLGYYMFQGHERRGHMQWALGVVIRHGWTALKLHRLEANIQPGNAASIALVRALGFEREGYSPAYLKIGGRWRDHERWAILAKGPRRAR